MKGWCWTRDDPARDQIRAERQQEGRRWGRKEDPTLTQDACQLRFIFGFVSFKHSPWVIFILDSFDILNLEMCFTKKSISASYFQKQKPNRLVLEVPSERGSGFPVPPSTLKPITHDLISISSSLCITILLTRIVQMGRRKSGWICGTLHLLRFRLHTGQRGAQCELVGGPVASRVTKSPSLWTESPLCDWILRSGQAMHVRYFYTFISILLWTRKCSPNPMFSRWMEDPQLAHQLGTSAL